MVRWMCGVTLKDRKLSEDLLDSLGVESVAVVVKRSRSRWFRHVERTSEDNWVSACRAIEVKGSRGRGRGRKTWEECVTENMKTVGVTREEARDCAVWRGAILGKRLTRASADNVNKNRCKT